MDNLMNPWLNRYGVGLTEEEQSLREKEKQKALDLLKKKIEDYRNLDLFNRKRSDLIKRAQELAKKYNQYYTGDIFNLNRVVAYYPKLSQTYSTDQGYNQFLQVFDPYGEQMESSSPSSWVTPPSSADFDLTTYQDNLTKYNEELNALKTEWESLTPTPRPDPREEELKRRRDKINEKYRFPAGSSLANVSNIPGASQDAGWMNEMTNLEKDILEYKDPKLDSLYKEYRELTLQYPELGTLSPASPNSSLNNSLPILIDGGSQMMCTICGGKHLTANHSDIPLKTNMPAVVEIKDPNGNLIWQDPDPNGAFNRLNNVPVSIAYTPPTLVNVEIPPGSIAYTPPTLVNVNSSPTNVASYQNQGSTWSEMVSPVNIYETAWEDKSKGVLISDMSSGSIVNKYVRPEDLSGLYKDVRISLHQRKSKKKNIHKFRKGIY